MWVFLPGIHAKGLRHAGRKPCCVNSPLKAIAQTAPVLGAMRPDRARLLTGELARHRSRANDPDGPDNSQDARR